jgi:DNA-binding NarL/FixJ family response regulator
VKVLLVDASAIFRMGLKAALAGSAGAVTVVGEAADGRQAIALFGELTPDVVVTDLHLPDRNGIALTRELRHVDPAARVLILAAHAPHPLVHQAIAAGASGYVLESQSPEEILAAVGEVARGGSSYPAGITPPEAGRPGSRNERTTPLHAIDRLSQRERQIFDLVVWGASNKQIAERLGISIKTVETHRGHINGKLRVHTSADIVRLASLWGMLLPVPSAPEQAPEPAVTTAVG